LILFNYHYGGTIEKTVDIWSGIAADACLGLLGPMNRWYSSISQTALTRFSSSRRHDAISTLYNRRNAGVSQVEVAMEDHYKLCAIIITIIIIVLLHTVVRWGCYCCGLIHEFPKSNGLGISVLKECPSICSEKSNFACNSMQP
jgi:hypothetical protein